MDELIGYGLLDLDYLLKSDKEVKDVKLKINYKNHEAGESDLKVWF